MQLKLLKRNNPYRGRVFNIVVDEVEYPSGNRSIREVAEHSGGAVIAAVDNGEILLIRQHRYPLGTFIWELPAGKKEKGEDPLHCAQRELAEETGYDASQWEQLTAIYTTPGFCDEQLHIFLATNLSPRPEGRALEEGEETMTLHRYPLATAVKMVEDQEILDGKSICGILLAERRLAKRS